MFFLSMGLVMVLFCLPSGEIFFVGLILVGMSTLLLHLTDLCLSLILLDLTASSLFLSGN